MVNLSRHRQHSIAMIKDVLFTMGWGAVVFLAMYLFVNIAKGKDLGTKFPKSSGYPIIGHFFDIQVYAVLQTLKDLEKKFGKIFVVEVFHKKILHVSDVDIARELLSKRPKPFKRGDAIEPMALKLGYLPFGLFHATDPIIWAKMKKMTAPAFSKQNVQSMAKVFYDESMVMVEKIRSISESKEVLHVLRELNSMTVNVISKVAFGNERVEYFFDQQFYDDSSILLKVVLEAAFFNLPEWVWKLTPMYKNEILAAEGNTRFERACQEVIDRKRRELTTQEEVDRKRSHCLIDIMIRQEGISDEEILANVKTFYQAGSDTTSVTMGWALLLLYRNPEIAEKMREEVKSFFSQSLDSMSAPAISDAIAGLTYSMGVIKEAIRLYPVAPLIFMDFIENQSAELSNGTVIGSDKTICIHAWSCLLSEDHFPRASTMQPERWLTKDPDALARMERAFLGFGGGTRACPGMTMALSESVMGLAALVHNFDFTLACPDEEVVVEYKFTMQPNKLPMKFTPRFQA